MNHIEKQVRRSFGCDDKRFASHSIEEQAIKVVRQSIKRGDYTGSDAINEAKRYLTSQGCTQDHIDSEMEKVTRALS